MSEQEKHFSLQRIYLKDLSFEAPQGAKAFMSEWKPQVKQDINTRINKIDEAHFEVLLGLTITVENADNTAFLVEVQQGGLFQIKGLLEQELAQVLNTTAPQILFPYAREVIDGAVVKGNFPALMLPPINFEALYAQALQQKQAETEKPETTH